MLYLVELRRSVSYAIKRDNFSTTTYVWTCSSVTYFSRHFGNPCCQWRYIIRDIWCFDLTSVNLDEFPYRINVVQKCKKHPSRGYPLFEQLSWPPLDDVGHDCNHVGKCAKVINKRSGIRFFIEWGRNHETMTTNSFFYQNDWDANIDIESS